MTTTYRYDLRTAVQQVLGDAVGGSPWTPDMGEAADWLVTTIDATIDGQPTLKEVLDRARPIAAAPDCFVDPF